ncbi:MAG: hypothetical protein AB4060_04815, partial [Crocosphaera sp.]
VTLSLETPKKKAMVANIRQADGFLLPIGEFTTNQKASKLALSKVGLFKEGATFQAKINSRVTAASIEIKPDSLEYPALGQWQGTSENTTEIELEPTAKRFIETITTQPTLLHRFDQKWQHQGQIETLPTLGLSVDLNRVAATQEFLEKYHIPYKLIPLDDKSVKMETERSYGVFTMIESDVPPNIRQWMEQASKGVFDANNSDKNALSPYHQRLISILPLSANQQQERLKNSEAVYQKVNQSSKPLSYMVEEVNNRKYKKPENVYQLIPLSNNSAVEKNRIKDRNMASIATQFIGVPAQNDPNKASSTRDYQIAWNQYNLANTGDYTPDDTIMVSGSGPWRGVTHEQIKATFETHYKPLLEKAIDVQASFVVGNAKGTDKLVINYLKERGYELTQQDNYFSAKAQLNINTLENHDNISTESNTPLISIDDIPSNLEIDVSAEQQVKTDLVAPIAAQFLKVQDQSNSPTRHFQGKEITIDYDGRHLTIRNNQDNSIKMKARFVGVNPATKKSQWLSELPENSPGLRDADVQKWTSETVKKYINQKRVEQESKKGLSLTK